MSSFLVVQIQQDLILFNRVKIIRPCIRVDKGHDKRDHRLSVSSLLSWRPQQMHHPMQGQSLRPGPPSHFILWDCMTCVITLESYLRNLASMTLTLIASNTQISHGLLLALPKGLLSKSTPTTSILSIWLFDRLCPRVWLAQNSVQLFGNSFKCSPLTAYANLFCFATTS